MQITDHTKTIIEAEGISFSYGDDEVLKDISLEVHKGDYLGIIGPNGAGKTTFLKILLGLLKPASGKVRLFGQDISEFKDWWRIGYVPQKATNFDANFPSTVEETVLMGRYSRKGLFRRLSKEDIQFTEQALKQVEMLEYKDRLIGELSGGQQQRVFIARALAGQPEVIFLDEPTTGIDEKSQQEFYALLRKLNRELGLTLVLVSHDIEMVTKEVMHIACIDHTLVCHTSPEEYLKESESISIAGQKVKIMEHHHRH